MEYSTLKDIYSSYMLDVFATKLHFSLCDACRHDNTVNTHMELLMNLKALRVGN